MFELTPVILIALAGASTLSIGICALLGRGPAYRRLYFRRIAGSVFFFSVAAILFISALSLGFLKTTASVLTVTGMVFLLLGWASIASRMAGLIFGPLFFERRPSWKDQLRWHLATGKNWLARRIGAEISGRLIGPPPSGSIQTPMWPGVEIPLGTMFFIYGPSDLDLRYFAYQLCASHRDAYLCFNSFDQPPYTLVCGDNLARKLGSKMRDGKLFIIDGFTKLYGLKESASLREWDLRAVRVGDGVSRDGGSLVDFSPFLLRCLSIHTLHKQIRRFRRIVDRREGGPGRSNNRIAMVHNQINFLLEGEDDLAFYAVHALQLERQIGWIDIFTLNADDRHVFPKLFGTLLRVADFVVELNECCTVSDQCRKTFHVRKCRYGTLTPVCGEYRLVRDERETFVELVGETRPR